MVWAQYLRDHCWFINLSEFHQLTFVEYFIVESVGLINVEEGIFRKIIGECQVEMGKTEWIELPPTPSSIASSTSTYPIIPTMDLLASSIAPSISTYPIIPTMEFLASLPEIIRIVPYKY